MMFRVLIIDDQLPYRTRAVQAVQAQLPSAVIYETNDYEEACIHPVDVDLIVLDNLNAGESFWDELLCKLRDRYRQAVILLVSAFSEVKLQRRLATFKAETKALLAADPLIEFLPKEEQGIAEHYSLLAQYAQRLADKKRDGLELEKHILTASLEAAQKIWTTSIQSLLKPVGRRDPAHVLSAIELSFKEDTLRLDVVAERVLHKKLVPILHKYQVIICTEEAGLHNRLYHRIQSPEFFVFSDPFDGSTLFKEEAKSALKSDAGITWLQGRDRKAATFEQFLATGLIQKSWKGQSIELNAPVISISLAERHRVTSSVVVNLFTGDVWIACSRGLYFRNCDDLLRSRGKQGIDAAVNALLDFDDVVGGWKEFQMRKSCSAALPKDKLYLCQMQARALRDSGERKWINTHFTSCVAKFIPWAFNHRDSFQFRWEQHDFTPGPGRLLFLTQSSQAAAYSKTCLDDRKYDLVLSAGEPITEWIGWFAFLRRAKGMRAFCLRPQEAAEVCTHKRKPGDTCVALPKESESIFKDGYMDLYVLSSSLGGRMREYKDTIAVTFSEDSSWDEKAGNDGWFGQNEFAEINPL